MEIKKITDKKVWEDTLKRFDYTTMFLSWEWSQFEKNFETWGIFEKGMCIGLIPIKKVLARRGKYLHVRHGPLIDWSDKDVVEKVVKFLRNKVKETGAFFVRISPLIKKTPENENLLRSLDFVPSATHATDAELTVVLDLTQSEEEIMANMRKTTRNLVRKAKKLGIKVRNVNDLSLFEDFKKVYLDTIKRQKWNAYTIDYIKREYEMFARGNKARTFVAYYKSEPISASIFIEHENQVIYHFSGSVTKHRNIPSTYLLHWEAIKHFKKQGLTLYNFWGVSPAENKKHPWYGLSLFKRGFSKKELEFVHSHDLILNPLAYLTRVYEYMEAKRRGYR